MSEVSLPTNPQPMPQATPPPTAMARNPRRGDRLAYVAFLVPALVVLGTLVLVYAFVGSQAYQTFTSSHINVVQFFLSTKFDGQTYFNIGIYILGSLTLVLLVLVISVPFSVGCAIFIAEVCPFRLKPLLRGIVELFLGIPSIIFGLIGLLVVVPAVAYGLNYLAGGIFYPGDGVIAAVLVVTFMILPTICTVSIDALRAVPQELREGCLALGATRWQTVWKIVVPAALPGITTGIILGIARALGETVAVAFVIGGAQHVPFAITNVYPYIYAGPTSVLTILLLFNFKEALPGTALYNSLWTVSFVLLLISAVLVGVSRFIASRRIYA